MDLFPVKIKIHLLCNYLWLRQTSMIFFTPQIKMARRLNGWDEFKKNIQQNSKYLFHTKHENPFKFVELVKYVLHILIVS